MRRPRNSVLFSFALHALAVAAVTRVAWQSSQPLPSKPASVVWLTAPAPSPLPAQRVREIEAAQDLDPQPPGQSSAATAENVDEGAERHDDSVAPKTASTESVGPPSRPTVIDLSEARRRAIESTLEERERGLSRRSFLFHGTVGEQQAFDESERRRREEAGLQAPLTAFDSPSKGRAGLSSQLALGEPTRWTSDDCFQLLGTNNLFLFGAARGLFDVPANICVRRTARGDLFRSAKPSTLMDAEERADTEEHVARMERLRRPTTGSVMPMAGP